MRLLIVRHGDPDYSIDSLTSKGRREAALLADKLSKEKIDAFYVSPLGRARHTAEYTLEKMGRTATECEWLHEFDRARINRPDRERAIPWDWRPKDWIGCEELYTMDGWDKNPVMAEGGVGEEYRRVTAELDKLLAAHGYVREGNLYRAERANEDTIVFFCHFGVEAVLLSHLLNIPPVLLWQGTCALPTSVTTVVTEEREKGIAYFRMNGFGDLSHLYAGGEEASFAARFCETYDNPEQRHD